MTDATATLTTGIPDEAEIRALAQRPGMARLLQSQILLAEAIRAQEARPSREDAGRTFAGLLNSGRDDALIDLAARVDALERLMDSVFVTVGQILATDAAREAQA